MLAMRKVERQISQGLLKLRADLDTAGLASDVGIRTHLLSCLMSYEPFWLLLGLDVVVGCVPDLPETSFADDAAQVEVRWLATSHALMLDSMTEVMTLRSYIVTLYFCRQSWRSLFQRGFFKTILTMLAPAAEVLMGAVHWARSC